MGQTRRTFIKFTALGAGAMALGGRLAWAQESGGVNDADRVFIANEDSNTITVIDPKRNVVEKTINLTSFDEDPRPPFRFVTGGIVPAHGAMIHKPLYHGCIDAHGVVPSPDGRLIATAGRGSSNVYLIDAVKLSVIGNTPNRNAGSDTNAERITSGILVGREPHEPTFTRNGRELWIALRGEDRIAILGVEGALRQSRGESVEAIRAFLPTIEGPAQVWFSKNGDLAFVASQKVAKVDVFRTGFDQRGRSHPKRLTTLDITDRDKPAFTPFLKTTPDGSEIWLSHKLADQISAMETREPFRSFGTVALGEKARPNHLEFVENARGKVTYVSLARVDDGGPGGVASSPIAIIDRSSPRNRKVVDLFFSHGREAHGLWTNPENNLLYIAHEQDELPGTPNAGQTVASAFDVSDPFKPRFIAQIPLGALTLPSGDLRNKKSINLVYVRPGHKGQTA